MLEVDLTPADMKLYVLEGEPSNIIFPVKINGEPVDVAAEFTLTTRTRAGEGEVVEVPVEVQNTNEVIATIPALAYVKGQKVYWEMRDTAANRTWITASVIVERDKV